MCGSVFKIDFEQTLAAIEQRVARVNVAPGADKFDNVCTLIGEQHRRNASCPASPNVDNTDT